MEDILDVGAGGDAAVEPADRDRLGSCGTEEEEGTAAHRQAVSCARTSKGQAGIGESRSVFYEQGIECVASAGERQIGGASIAGVIERGVGTSRNKLFVFSGGESTEAVAQAAKGAVGDEGVAHRTGSRGIGTRVAAHSPRQDADVGRNPSGGTATAHEVAAGHIGRIGKEDFATAVDRRVIHVGAKHKESGVVVAGQAGQSQPGRDLIGSSVHADGIGTAAQGHSPDCFITGGDSADLVAGEVQAHRRHRGVGRGVGQGNGRGVVEAVRVGDRTSGEHGDAAVVLDGDGSDTAEVGRDHTRRERTIGERELGTIDGQGAGEGIVGSIQREGVADGCSRHRQRSRARELAGVGGVGKLVDGQIACRADGHRAADADGTRDDTRRNRAAKQATAREAADGFSRTVDVEGAGDAQRDR